MNDVQRRKGLFTIIFGAFAVFFTGYPHIWSIYQPYVMEVTGWTQGQASMCFYLALLIFVFGNIVGGRMLERFSPRLVILLGGGLFAGGVLLSAYMLFSSPLPMYITYGAMQGFGQGMVYTTVVSAALKWFPKRVGLASGVVVTANGLCGFFLTPLSRILLERGGVRSAFLVVGGLMAAAWILASIFVESPPKQTYAEEQEMAQPQKEISLEYTSGEMMQTKRFYLLLATMLCGLMPYFFVSPIAQTLQTQRGIAVTVAAGAVMMGSVANAGVRLCLPALADKVGRVVCIKVVLAVSIVTMVVLFYSRSYLTTAAVVAVYGCYGGIMGIFPSFTGTIFGLKHVGENYGYVMVGMVIAALGAPVVANAVASYGGSQETVFMMGGFFAVAAVVCLVLLEKELQRKNKNTHFHSGAFGVK